MFCLWILKILRGPYGLTTQQEHQHKKERKKEREKERKKETEREKERMNESTLVDSLRTL